MTKEITYSIIITFMISVLASLSLFAAEQPIDKLKKQRKSDPNRIIMVTDEPGRSSSATSVNVNRNILLGMVWVYPFNIQPPAWTQPGIQLDTTITIVNDGDVDFLYSITVEEDNGASGWLGYSGLSGVTPHGLNNTEVGTLHLNNGGVETSDPIVLVGRLIFDSNLPTSPDTFRVSLIVASNVEGLDIDTIYSSCLALSVSNTGNYGNMGKGGVNLDWTYSGTDCYTDASVYLYDGSPVILWDNGSDTAGYWSIFGESWYGDNGFRPQTASSEGTTSVYNWYSSGTFTTQDSSVALEQTWYAPTIDCGFMVKKLKIWSFDGAIHDGLRIGEAIDWDVPSDSLADNSSLFDAGRNLIYQVGAEFDQDDTLSDGSINPIGNDCVNANTRFAGVAFYSSFLNPNGYYYDPIHTFPYSASTIRNDSFVFPAGNFVPGQLYREMGNAGYSTETAIADLSTVICYEPNFNLGANDTLEIYTIYATVYDGTLSDLQYTIDQGNLWLNNIIPPCPNGCCCGIRGNVDGDGGDNIDIADLVYFVTYAFGGGSAPVCYEEADVDASGSLDIADIVYLVNYMFSAGPAPLDCW